MWIQPEPLASPAPWAAPKASNGPCDRGSGATRCAPAVLRETQAQYRSCMTNSFPAQALSDYRFAVSLRP